MELIWIFDEQYRSKPVNRWLAGLPVTGRSPAPVLSLIIVVVRLSGKQEMQGSILCEGDYPFLPFCCHSIVLLSSHNKLYYHFYKIPSFS
jgi:hypothetical protein